MQNIHVFSHANLTSHLKTTLTVGFVSAHQLRQFQRFSSLQQKFLCGLANGYDCELESLAGEIMSSFRYLQNSYRRLYSVIKQKIAINAGLDGD